MPFATVRFSIDADHALGCEPHKIWLEAEGWLVWTCFKPSNDCLVAEVDSSGSEQVNH